MNNEPSDQYDDVHRMAADRLVDDINARLAAKGPNINGEALHATECAFDSTLRQMTDSELAAQALELKAKVDAHMKEMARRLFKNDRPGESG